MGDAPVMDPYSESVISGAVAAPREITRYDWSALRVGVTASSSRLGSANL